MFYITAVTLQLSIGTLKPLRTENHAFPPRFFMLRHAFLVMTTFEFGIQPPVKPQDAKLISRYKY